MLTNIIVLVTEKTIKSQKRFRQNRIQSTY